MPITIVAIVVVVAFAISLMALTGMAFMRPVSVERFFMAFASSARTHYLEQVARLVVGAALVVASSAMWQPKVFWLIGWAMVASSAALICVPWQWHHKFGNLVRPTLFRHLRLYSIGAFVFGSLLLYGVLAKGWAS